MREGDDSRYLLDPVGSWLLTFLKRWAARAGIERKYGTHKFDARRHMVVMMTSLKGLFLLSLQTCSALPL